MGYTVTENHSEFDRGVAAGEIAARLASQDRILAGQDRTLAAQNHSLADISTTVHDLAMKLQRLADASAADRETVKSTAAALKAAGDERREAGETRWAPLTRLSLIAGIVLAVTGVIAFIDRKSVV